MATNYSITYSKLDNLPSRKFDIKTKRTKFKKDIDLGPFGTLSRVVGLDKLSQQASKSVILNKGTYTTNESLGTALISNKNKNTVFVTADIQNSLSTYAKIQQRQVTSNITEVLGRNIYRSIDNTNINGWEKVNGQVLSANTYTDIELSTEIIYYYAMTTVYKDTSNSTKETQISSYLTVDIPVDNTMNAGVSQDFIIIFGSREASLYWNLPVALSKEEQLRSILDIKLNTLSSDPRALRIDVKITNRELTTSQIEIIRGE